MNSDIAIVTGASRGIGRAIAIGFAKDGAKVALFGRDSEKLEETKRLVEKVGSEAIIFTGDVADESFVTSSVDEVVSKFGRVDHLVNNAGTAVFKKLVDSSLDEFKSQIDANLIGVYNFSKAVAKKLIEQKSGSIINIASLAGKNGFANGTMYTATKHAVLGFTKSLMMELREYNIRVASICPGSVRTDLIMDTFMEPKNVDTLLAPEDIAWTVMSIIKLPPRALISDIDIRPANKQ